MFYCFVITNHTVLAKLLNTDFKLKKLNRKLTKYPQALSHQLHVIMLMRRGSSMTEI